MATTPTTKKQRACPHPAAWVHPTFDDHFEICDLCKLVRPRPLPAPWIVAHDDAITPPPAPELFAHGPASAAPAPASVPVVAATVPAVREHPRLDPDDPRYLRACPRCGGAGTIRDHAEAVPQALRAVPGHSAPGLSPTIAGLPHVAGIGRQRDHTARPCPRCQGARRVGTYDPHGTALPQRVIDQIA